MHKSILFVGLFSAAAIASSLAACSSTMTTSSPETNLDAGKDTGTSSGSSGSSGTSGTSGSSGSGEEDASTDPDKACGAAANQNACAQCCATNHASGYKTFTDSLFACACKGTGTDAGTGPCAKDCETSACAATPAALTPACNTCLQNSVSATGACQPPVVAACSANPDCLAQQKCVPACQKLPVK